MTIKVSLLLKGSFSQWGNSISCFYSLFKEYEATNTSNLKETWERELNIEIKDDDLEERKKLKCLQHKENSSAQNLHKVNIFPSQRHKFNFDY